MAVNRTNKTNIIIENYMIELLKPVGFCSLIFKVAVALKQVSQGK